MSIEFDRVAGPVISRLAADLQATEVTVVLSDARGNVVARETVLLPAARGAGRDSEGQLGNRPPRRRTERYGWESLTPAERSLAELVGLGLTNKAAAARLFVSRHTIDAHLRRIFRKLDINSRVELARLVAARAANAGDELATA
jgi:DNA-binding CsgD family transcriptional regulator